MRNARVRGMNRAPVIDPAEMYLVTVVPRVAGQTAITLLVRDSDFPREEAQRRQEANGFGSHDPYAPYRSAVDEAMEADPRFTHRDQFYAQSA